MAAKEYTEEEVARHCTEDDAWMIIDNEVYDLTKFIKLHPGGKAVLLPVLGKDATEAFTSFHRVEVLERYRARLMVGKLAGKDRQLEQPVISQVPFAEPAAFRPEFQSPYYNDSHRSFREGLRGLFKRVLPDANEMEDEGTEPTAEQFKELGMGGLFAARIGKACMGVVKQLGITLPGGVSPDQFDHFHELIAHEETGHLSVPGLVDGLGSGLVIGLPPVIHFGKGEIQKRVVGECLRGEKKICLAITEPHAGSDVAGVFSSATKTPCGKFYIVNGVKKWITNGTFSDYFVTAVRTEKGISLLLIERSEGVVTKKIKTSYSPAAGTSLITFDNVKVPVENLLGKEHQGFKCIMANFNHERWFICAAATSASRVIVEDCWKWVHQRKAFKKRLLDQPVIRYKMARMIAAVESVHNWLESLTYQMEKMDYASQTMRLAGDIALLKLQVTRTMQLVSDEACQIFGGRAITKTGMGRNIERFQRTFKFAAILGGSEEIMADLGVRQAARYMPEHARL